MAEADRMLDVADRAYAGALGEAPWGDALSALTDLFDGQGLSMEVADRRSGRVLFFDSARIDPANADAYVRYYHATSPRVEFEIENPDVNIAYDRLLIDEAGMERDPFYAEFLAAQGMRYFVSSRIDHLPGLRAIVAVQRSARAGHVEQNDIDRLQALQPHLRRAFALLWTRIDGGLDLDHLDRGLASIGVTPAERRLAMALVGGQSVLDHARHRGISPHTAYTHYKRLKGKLDCNKQPELVARLFALSRLPRLTVG
jgi:DNA-binding CsgD family transcriptional regulator